LRSLAKLLIWVCLVWLAGTLAFPLLTAQETRRANTENDDTTEEDDRTRERNAEREARRIQSRIVRGPYLQCGTPESMMVRWRTDKPAGSTVRFGPGATSLKYTARTPGLHVDHVVVLTNLLPDTRYYYALSTNTFSGTNKLLTASTNWFFTAPVAGTVKAFRAWVLGDSGTRRPVQYAVTAGFYKFNGDRQVDLWLMLGDNAYTSGTDAEYHGAIFLAYVDMLRRAVLWPCLGNHDGGSASSPAQAGYYYNAFTLPTQGQAGGVMSGTEAYYSYDYANAHFIALDSHDSDRSTNGLMLRWLKADLASNTQTWTIAYFHHPPYTKGSHDSDNDRDGESRSRHMRENFLPVLEQAGADLVLCGHSHAYERTPLMLGHYGRSTNFSYAYLKDPTDGCEAKDGPYRKPAGRSPNSGTVYVVAGSSGQTSGIKAAYPAMLYAVNTPGSVALDIDANRLDLSFIDTNGIRRDYFTIMKGSAPARVEPRPPLIAQREHLLETFRASTNVQQKTELVWQLAAVADPFIGKELGGVVTNKVRDRIISAEEEKLRIETVRALGLVAARYEPAVEILRKGMSADWWFFRTNYLSARPQHESAADLASAAIEAMGLTGRPDLRNYVVRASTNYVEFTYGEPPVVFRNYAKEFERTISKLSDAARTDPFSAPRRASTQ
jgi:calcineurin-like phosphoesterase family protein/purple acid phosphatase-like protein